MTFTEQALVAEERAIKEFLMRIAGYASKRESPVYTGDLFASFSEGNFFFEFIDAEWERADFTLSGFVSVENQAIGDWWFGAFDGGYRGGPVWIESMDLGECEDAGTVDTKDEC